MRTTLDLDPELLSSAMACYPPGTPKTVVVEEGLRLLALRHRTSAGPPRELGFFADTPVGVHEDFDAPLDEAEQRRWSGG